MDKRLTKNVTNSETYNRVGKAPKKAQQNELIRVKNEPKNEFIHIRCSSEHRYMLEQAAKRSGFNLSNWVLHCALNFQGAK